jgi:hypothetical protein
MSKKLFFIVISAVFMFLSCGGNDSCSTSKSYGINSLTRKDVAQTCYEKISESSCYRNYTSEQVESIIREWQDKKFVFHKDSCKDLKDPDKTVECPDFIPDLFNFSKLEGCEIYTIDPDTKCDAPCYDLYFSTNDRYFPKAFFQEFGEKYINSVSSDGLVKFSSTIELNGSTSASFVWSEKAEDGAEIEKGVRVYMEIVDPSDVEDEPVSDEDADIEMNEE